MSRVALFWSYQKGRDEMTTILEDFIKSRGAPRTIARTRNTMSTPIKNRGITYNTRAAFIFLKIEDGAKVELHRGQRWLVNEDGSFLTEDDITKIAMDFAAYLQAIQSEGLA
jgi:hypothetical protein